MPNGCADAGLHKTFKASFFSSYIPGLPSVVFLDDSILQGDTDEECSANVSETVTFFQSLGFSIHLEKSVLTPTREIEFLGYVINTVCLSARKVTTIHEQSLRILTGGKHTIREIPSLLGRYVATAETVPYAQLHNRALERSRNKALKTNKGKFEAKMSLNEEAKADVSWWLQNIATQVRYIAPLPMFLTIYSDASKTVLVGSTSGKWLPQE